MASECSSSRRISKHCFQPMCSPPVPQQGGLSAATNGTTAAASVQQQSAADQIAVTPTNATKTPEESCKAHAAPCRQRRFSNPAIRTMSSCGPTLTSSNSQDDSCRTRASPWKQRRKSAPSIGTMSTFDSASMFSMANSFSEPSFTSEWDRNAALTNFCRTKGSTPAKFPSDSQITMASAMDMKALRLSREDELLAKVREPQEEEEEASEELSDGPVSEMTSSMVEEPVSVTPPVAPLLWWCMGQRVDSPLVLRFCGILYWGRRGEAYCCLMLLVAMALVAVFALQFYQVQRRSTGHADCPGSICLHFGYLSDLVLAVGSLLGLVAMRRLRSMQLLGDTSAVLMRFALQHQAVPKWSRSTSWLSLCLAVLWLGSLTFRAATVPSDLGWREVAQACAFALTSLIFMALVFGVVHASCCICVLIDSYALGVRSDKDLVKGVEEWDKLTALLRRVACGVEWGFSLVQTTSVIMLLCTIIEILLQGEMPIWWFMSNMLLATGMVLLIFKAAEVTEKCARMPSLINNMDFDEDNGFSMQKHYLVQHIAYSDAGFYVGEVRLTARMVFRIMYGGLLAGFGVLAKLTTV